MRVPLVPRRTLATGLGAVLAVSTAVLAGPAAATAAPTPAAPVHPASAPDGADRAEDVGPNGLIAYSAWDETGYNVYVYDPVTPEVPPVALTTDGWSNANPKWSPDGTKIVYDSWADRVGGPRIRVMDADPTTDDHLTLTDPCPDSGCYGDMQPAWSPDGTRIAFVSSRPLDDGTEHWTWEVFVMDATGEVGDLPPATRLTLDEQDEWGSSIDDSQVTWSPDGERIAIVSTGRGEDQDTCDLWTMDPYDRDGDGFGDDLQQLTFDESSNCSSFEDLTPEWSPSSSLIAWTSTRTGYWDIWLVNADDLTDLRNVTNTPAEYEDQPGWSADGTEVIFRRADDDGVWQLWSVPVPPPGSVEGAGGQPKQLTFDDVEKTQPHWGTEEGALPGTETLAVTRVRGKGVVVDPDDKIRCGARCVATYVERTKVELTAEARPGWTFDRWKGACRASDGTTCTVRLKASRQVAAVFVRE